MNKKTQKANWERVQKLKYNTNMLQQQYHELLIVLCKSEYDISEVSRFLSFINERTVCDMDEINKIMNAVTEVIMKCNLLQSKLRNLKVAATRCEFHRDYMMLDQLDHIENDEDKLRVLNDMEPLENIHIDEDLTQELLEELVYEL